MDQTEKKEVLRSKEKEFQTAKNALHTLGKEKEEAFNQMRTHSSELKSLNQQLDSLKGERDELSKKVRDAKKERSALNQKVKESSTILKSARENAPSSYSSDSGRRSSRYDKKEKSPAQMQKEIDNLEVKLETEAMAFSKEKEIKKTIKILKTEMKKKSAVQETYALAKTAGKEFHSVRKAAEVSHKQVQEFAEASQEKHQAMQEVLIKIKKQRKLRDPKGKEYATKKDTWTKQKKICDELAEQIKVLKEELGMQSQKEIKIQAKEKIKEVEAKLKRGDKLTTEDFLAMQGSK
ncbi:hypothetical protein CL619_01645 [archaeon]|nr:hypothetical protein [archaeon]|tara:strand:- start:1714 stop:2592 length:879 start_codon:yes stop_codon:yes gene_type:complete